MSSLVIARSSDLARLRNEKYEIQIHPSNHLVVRNIPHVNSAGEVAYGTLIVPIVQIADSVVGKPQNHQAYFAGDFPHKRPGEPLLVLGQNSPGTYRFADDLEAQYHLSYKSPKVNAAGSYDDYYDLVTSYVEMAWSYARRVYSDATPLTGRVRDYDDEPSVFAYCDTASTRAGITVVSQRLEGHVIAIIGIGGTGSYLLDLVAKTPVREIRIYDGDRFSQHNAFRAPGAAAADDVFAVPPHFKVDFFSKLYSAMHLHIVPHPVYLAELPPDFNQVDFAFLCIDKSASKRRIVEGLTALNKPFIDVGMGISLGDRALGGLMRTTLSTEECRSARHAISFVDVEDDYALNIQVADLNALNAALAVVRWKKFLGFYNSPEAEWSSVYTIDFNRIDNGGGRDAN